MIQDGDWRRLRGLLAALLIFAFAGVPSLEGLACAEEPPVATHLHETTLETSQTEPCEDTEPGPHGSHHGHCHHASGLAPLGLGVGAPYGRRLDHGLPLGAGAVSDLKFGLIRPPRG